MRNILRNFKTMDVVLMLIPNSVHITSMKSLQ